MKKRYVGASIVATIFGVVVLYYGIFYLNVNLESYMQCLNGETTRSCPFYFSDNELILMPIALFGFAIWLWRWGIRGRLSRVLHFRAIVPVLIAATASVLSLVLSGIQPFFYYLDCISGRVTYPGLGPSIVCGFPLLQFVLPLVMTGIASAIITFYARDRGKKRVESSQTADGT
ncbi:MAG TPA: hypothetical protein VGQ13_09320 [Nitrososphaera sp.]|jgi:hypothetical protein|nr:hypothetical protein [Nitrososphaera sp.]